MQGISYSHPLGATQHAQWKFGYRVHTTVQNAWCYSVGKKAEPYIKPHYIGKGLTYMRLFPITFLIVTTSSPTPLVGNMLVVA